LLWALAGAALGLAPGCTAPAKPTDVLVVTIDTARADHFSFAGDAPVATPNIDRVASEGVAFLTALAPTPITLPSHATLFTGLDPPRHGVRNNGTFRLSDDAVTLAEILSGEGYATAAFLAAAVLDRRYGLAQGFSLYDDRVEAKGTSGLFQYPRRSGERVVTAALDWLSGQKPSTPTFVWVHIFDPHAPYDPPEPERSLHAASPYAGEIAYADRVVGDLLDGYRSLERYDEAVLLITSDHGESLGEHGESTHGVFLYDATLRVPLVLRAPEVGAGQTVRQQVGLVDVLPTVTGLLGLEAPGDLDGIDLSTLVDGTERGPRPALYLESRLPLLQYGWSPLAGLRTEEWKLISGVEPELYQLGDDPHEIHDLAATRGKQTRELLSVLSARAAVDQQSATTLEMDDESRARLEALGYLTLTRAHSEDDASGLPDPRTQIVGMQRMREAVRRYSRGDRAGGIAAARAATVAEPDNVTAWTQLGDLLSLDGEYHEAAGAYARATELDPRSGKVAVNLGFCLEQLGREHEALELYRQVRPDDPEHARGRHLRWGLLQRLGRGEEAAREAREALASDPRDGGALLLLALDRREREGPAGVVAGIEQALHTLPGDPTLTVALAAEKAALGQHDEAVALYRQVLAASATHQQAAAGLGRVLLIAGRIGEAARILEPAGNTPHPEPDLLLVLAEARTRGGRPETALPIARQAVALRPDRADAWGVLGSVQLSLGNDEAAAEAYRRALGLDPRDRISGLNLASALERLGRLEEAAALRASFRASP
jgi:arylsulfatase A-like enzyme/Tfp pilus assembly protein PilF